MSGGVKSRLSIWPLLSCGGSGGGRDRIFMLCSAGAKQLLLKSFLPRQAAPILVLWLERASICRLSPPAALHLEHGKPGDLTTTLFLGSKSFETLCLPLPDGPHAFLTHNVLAGGMGKSTSTPSFWKQKSPCGFFFNDFLL